MAPTDWAKAWFREVCPQMNLSYSNPVCPKGFSPIIEKKMGHKETKMIYSTDTGRLVKTTMVDENQQKQFCITDKQALQLAGWVCLIEKHYSELKGQWCPMDTEWALDGLSGELYIVQARPETIHSRRKANELVEYEIDRSAEAPVALTGIAVGDKIGQGKVQKMYTLDGRDGSFDGSKVQGRRHSGH